MDVKIVLTNLLREQINICMDKFRTKRDPELDAFYNGKLNAYKHILRVIDDRKELCCGK